jgi:CcmD family protein
MLATLIQTAQDDIPVKDPVGLEVVMLQEDKLFVVLVVVLIIWLGVLWYLYRTDREIDQLEERLSALPEASDSL